MQPRSLDKLHVSTIEADNHTTQRVNVLDSRKARCIPTLLTATFAVGGNSTGKAAGWGSGLAIGLFK